MIEHELPPLRDRPDDLPLLVQTFLEEFSGQYNRKVPEISPDAIELLYDYSWPGNVRELRNCIESMVVLDKDGKIGVEDIPRYVKNPVDMGSPSGMSGINLEEGERESIRKALANSKGNREKAAAMLGIGERTLYRKIKRYGLF